jgi:ankyrin repeat protein
MTETAAPDASQPSPLLQALYRRDQAAVDALLQGDPALDLHEAAALGRVPRVRELLHAEPARVSSFSADGWTALHLAAHFGQVEAMKALLEEGAHARDRSRNGLANEALHAAAAGGHDHAVAVLLAHGADANARQHGGYTALHQAAAAGRTEMTRLLLDAGADRDATADDGSTARSLAEKGGHADVLRMLEAPAAG